MKRGWAILLAGALILAIALPVGAAKPDCDDPDFDHPACKTDDSTTTTTTTTIPDVVDCQFDEGGILQYWWSEDQSEPYRCRWTTSDRGPFTFHLTASSEDDDGSVLRPHMFVTDSYPYGDKCFDALDNGWHDLEYSWEESYAWESFTLPATGDCDDSFPELDPDGEDVFSLVIAARVKGTIPVVMVTQP